MNRLPLLISVPHAGKGIPPEVESQNLLKQDEILADGDVGADKIYEIADYVSHYVTTPIARAFIDMNRDPMDIRKDGVVKTHTCWDVPIYSSPLTPQITKDLISNYHTPYHEKLSGLSKASVILGVDCHTMADVGPPVGPDQGKKRPLVCLSNGEGTCPKKWLMGLQAAFAAVFGEKGEVKVNDPFKGGYITRYHSREMPWVQLEFSRTNLLSDNEKKMGVIKALTVWSQEVKP